MLRNRKNDTEPLVITKFLAQHIQPSGKLCGGRLVIEEEIMEYLLRDGIIDQRKDSDKFFLMIDDIAVSRF